MKTIKILTLILYFFTINCKTYVNIPPIPLPEIGGMIDDNAYIYINNYYYKEKASDKNIYSLSQGIILYKSFLHNGGDYLGRQYYDYLGNRDGFVQNGRQIGKWISKRSFEYDSLGIKKSKDYVAREEYFKNGLHDSIYKIYDKDGKTIYSTFFKNGTGIEKDFHKNGKLYYEIATKDGYFTDTLKLYNYKGRLQEKLLYKKDSLVYNQIFDTNVIDTIENRKKVKITYKNNKIEKKQFGNEIWWYNNGNVNLKSKDTIIKGIKKSYQEFTKEDNVTKSVYIRNNPIIDYESIFRYSKNILTSQVIVILDKVGNPQETETRYDEKGKLISITYRIHKAYIHHEKNYTYEKTDYYQFGKKYKRSELVNIETKILKYMGESDEIIQFRELNFYNLKNELIKKEYLKVTSKESGRSQGTSISFEIIVTEKIEYYNKNKLVKTEYFEKNKLIKTDEN
jgi:antitoxin component YwqK of YwqJK toxin-antitoxin module